MLRLVRQKLVKRKTVWNTIRQAYGLSDTAIFQICARFGLNRRTRIKHLTRKDIGKINFNVSKNYILHDALRHNVAAAFTEIYSSKRRRGLRMRQGLPVNGQRTRSNAETASKLKMRWLSRKYKQKLRRLKFKRLLKLKKKAISKKYQIKKQKDKAKK